MQRAARLLSFIPPMECRHAHALPEGPDWQYELKLDGYRVQAIKNNREVRLYSRNGKPFEDRFPEVTQAIRTLRAEEFIIDGEIVALDAKGGQGLLFDCFAETSPGRSEKEAALNQAWTRSRAGRRGLGDSRVSNSQDTSPAGQSTLSVLGRSRRAWR